MNQNKKTYQLPNYQLPIINYQLSILLTVFFFALPLKAQVNIGSNTSPHPFSILELTTTENNHGGLRLPQLNNVERDTVQTKFNETATTAEAAKGLVIYNTDTDCLEFWNGKEWISLCSDALPPQPTLEVDPTSMTFDGNGNITSSATNTATVKTNVPEGWTTSSDQSWCTVTPEFGAGTSLAVSCAANASNAVRTATIIVSATGAASQTIYVTQNMNINSISESGTVLPNTYVGAFWKHDQTGERIIRITGITTANAGAWTASVGWYDGQWNAADGDGIVLSASSTLDGSVSFTSDITPGDAELYPVTGGTPTVSGTITGIGTNNTIMFRIGLQKKFTTAFSEKTPDYTTTFPARYAVVLLSYKNNTLIQKIFIRQGEGPDYLMRGNDLPGAGSDITSRSASQCKQFSPYNLTATSLNQQAGYNGNEPNPGIFTDYPSKAGTLFQWANNNTGYTRYAWNAYTSGTLGGINSTLWNTSPSTYWNALKGVHETCPSGYRRPTDGKTDGADTGPTMTLSEMRQSLYLTPKLGIGVNSSDNSVWGYYADGFFDRRQITGGPVSSTYSGTNSSVSRGNNQIAHTGCLFYNPYNNASLFFPAAGTRYIYDSALWYAGASGFYWSGSSNSTTTAWFLLLSSDGASQSNNGRPYAFSVRCVKDN